MQARRPLPSRRRFRRWLVRGTVILLPSLVTLIVIGFVVNVLSGVLNPFVRGARLVDPDAPAVVVELLALALLVGGAVSVGYVADRRSTDRIGRRFHEGVESVPGVGQVYATFNQMTDLLSGEGAEAFREVKVVEFPSEGSYVLGFVTAETPDEIADPVGGDGMVTLFVPMAPNPVMGGFVVHARAERVYDTPLTVEQGLQSIVTSGVATESGAGGEG
jgi:uncharacterized membrane protein